MKRFEVIWTSFALDELDKIYEYYSSKSENSASKIVESIFSRTEQLGVFPLSGQEEEILKKVDRNHRYLVENNYKIIYRTEGNIVYVTDIFDTRQNPKKILRKK